MVSVLVFVFSLFITHHDSLKGRMACSMSLHPKAQDAYHLFVVFGVPVPVCACVVIRVSSPVRALTGWPYGDILTCIAVRNVKQAR